MALPNDSFISNPDASGTSLPTHLIGGKEYPVYIQADADGHIMASAAAYLLYQQPRVTTAAATDVFDLFNASGSGKKLRVRGLWPILNVTAAQTAVVATLDFSLIRTTTAGTGGTAHTFESATVPLAAGAVNISRPSTALAGALPAQVTARSVPTAGAAVGTTLFAMPLHIVTTMPELFLYQSINMIPEFAQGQPFEAQEGEGYKVRQITATASTGVGIGWLMAFTLV